MKTLQNLRDGLLNGQTELSLSCGLSIFPREIFDLSDTLEILNLSNNQLDTLPDDFDRLKKLRILFLSENNFKEIPKVLAKCNSLTMIGFKANKIESFEENVLPLNTQWLILTDNKIYKLPDSLGNLKKLQKCMLAGNRIKSLPESMQKCKNLELLRISANNIENLPLWLFTLPKLSWLACAGNIFSTNPFEDYNKLSDVNWNNLTIHEQLGEGASGLISRGYCPSKSSEVAIKIFKGEVTSDGYPEDEMKACISVGEHSNLTRVYAQVNNHPEEKKGLVMSLIPPQYTNLGKPPSFATCTRDIYDIDTSFTFPQLTRILKDISSSVVHLHQRGIMHGDLYAHNILIDENNHSILGDFGAATVYKNIEGIKSVTFERLEVRAFGCLIEDLLAHYKDDGASKHIKSIKALEILKNNCMNETVHLRPLLCEIYHRLQELEN